MKLLRLFTSLVLSLLLVFCCSGFSAFAADSDTAEYEGVVVETGSCGDSVEYTIYRVDADNYTLVISGHGDMVDYKSTSTRPWKSYSITRVVVEDGVDTIGAFSFYGMNSIKDVQLSDAISAIHDYAFCEAQCVDSINLPQNLMTLGNCSFYCCGRSGTGFNGELVIPEGVTNIPEKAFSDASGIESLSLPSTLKTIGESGFAYTSIRELTLPNRLTYLGKYAFGSCAALKELKTPASLKTIGPEAFYNSGLETISFEEGLEIIEASAFFQCKAKTIEIPASIKVLGDGCFKSSSFLESVYFNGDAPDFYKSGAIYTPFSYCNNVKLYYLADNPTWNSNNMPSGMVPWYNLETCNISYDEAVEYTGSYIKPEVTITCAGQTLEFGTQYTLRYANNKDVGTADIVISGMNECRGNVTKHFDITKKISDCDITLDAEVYFTGGEVAPDYTVTDGEKVLVEGQDYSVTYRDNVALGTATVVFKGEGCYTDTTEKTFEIVEKEHVWNAGEITQAPTCTAAGVRTFTCLGCGQTRTEVVPAEGHEWNSDYTVDVEPTCTTKGSKSIHCSKCDAQKPNTSVEMDLVDHEYGEWEILTVATCTTDGSKKKTCVHCGNTITEVIPAQGHSWDTHYTVDTEPTCNSKGSKSIHCSKCGVQKPNSSVEIEMLDHEYGEWEITKEATCTRDGSQKKTCKHCGHTVTEAIPAEGHDWNSGKITEKATCTEDGIRTYTCNSCGDTKEEMIPALGHNWDEEYTVDTEASCSAEGTKSIHCIRCDKKKAGTEVAIPKKAHTFGDWVIITPATYSETGIQEHACEVCGFTEQEVIPELTRTDISTLTIPDISAKTYTGKALTPAITIKDGDTELVKDTDYTITYSNNTKIGTATITIEGINGYTGTAQKTFAIKGDLSKTVTKVSVGSISAKTYSGSALKPSPAVKAVGTSGSVVTLKKDTDYKLSYSNNKSVGKATVTITGIGKYTGTKKVTFKINPKGTTISSVSAASKGFTVKWKKQATQTTGYQIYYTTSSTKPKASTSPKATISKTGTVSKKVTGLKGGKKYYAYVRTYKTVNGVKYYSTWSKVKTVTTKK